MTTPLTHDEFAKHLHTKFRALVSDMETVELEMTELSEQRVSSQQELFSIIFRGPQEKPLGQGTRRFEHEQMGEFDLFIVPIGASDGMLSYEAAFNRLIRPADSHTPA